MMEQTLKKINVALLISMIASNSLAMTTFGRMALRTASSKAFAYVMIAKNNPRKVVAGSSLLASAWFFGEAQADVTADDSIRDPKNMGEVAPICAAIAEKLQKQPLSYEFNYTKGRGYKILPLSSGTLPGICQIISQNTKEILGQERGWPIYEFSNFAKVSQPVHEGDWIRHGVTLLTADEDRLCGATELEKVYGQLTEKVSQGWVAADPAKFPHILHKEDPKDWFLFIKNKADLGSEDTFVRSLAASFGLRAKLSCHNAWTKDNAPGFDFRNPLYLWIKKDGYQAVAQAFNLPKEYEVCLTLKKVEQAKVGG